MKKIVYILLFSAIASSAIAQDNLISWQYSIGFGSGDLHTFINKASFRGLTLNYYDFVKPNVAVGIEAGWNMFYEEKPFDTYTTGNIEYSGKQWRYSNEIPLLVTFSYFRYSDNPITPFAGLGIGTLCTIRYTDMGQYRFKYDVWHFALKPELGLLYKTEGGVDFMISSKYYYGFKAAELSAQSYFTINIGLAFKL